MKNHIWILVLLGLTALGCGGDDYREVEVHPVRGRLTIGGKPAHGAYITLHPRNNVGMTKGNRPFARVESDGSFTITTYDSADGAPIGDFDVTVIWPEDPEAHGPSPDRLKGRYEKVESSEISVSIQENTTELEPWDLKP